MNSLWLKLVKNLPPSVTVWLSAAVSVVLGLLAAVILHYMLYRFGLPSKPFIYVAF